jgi:hypothetical protein
VTEPFFVIFFQWVGGTVLMGFSLVALDTDHIKEYVFGTDKLKEIRGASSLLDYLNRIVMQEFADNYRADVALACVRD